MSRDQHMISRSKCEKIVRFTERYLRGAGKQQHPLRFLLIVPEPLRAGVPPGDDPFDAYVLITCEDFG